MDKKPYHPNYIKIIKSNKNNRIKIDLFRTLLPCFLFSLVIGIGTVRWFSLDADGILSTYAFAGGLDMQDKSYQAGEECVKSWQVNPNGIDSPVILSSRGSERGGYLDDSIAIISPYAGNPPWIGDDPNQDPVSIITMIEEDPPLVITLISGHDDEGDPLSYRISSFSAVGKLYQYISADDHKGDPIDTFPAEITDPDHQVVYEPVNRTMPYTDTFYCRVSDGTSDSVNEARVEIRVAADNDRPWIGDNPAIDPYIGCTIDEEDDPARITFGPCRDAEGEPLTFFVSTNIDFHGRLYQYSAGGENYKGARIYPNTAYPVAAPDPNLTIVYEPVNRTGTYTDTFYCRVSDGTSDSGNKERVDIRVTADNDKPWIGDNPVLDPNMACTIDEENNPVMITFGPCRDAEGEPLTFFVSMNISFYGRLYHYSASGENHKGAPMYPDTAYPVAAPDPNLTIVYEPANRTSTYTDTFYCRVSDGTSDSGNKERVDIRVTAVNDRPWIGDDSAANQTLAFTINEEDPPITIILSSSHDKDEDASLSYCILSLPFFGKLYQYIHDGNHTGDLINTFPAVVKDSGHRIVYEPANRISPYTDTFTCKVNDAFLDSNNTEIVHIDVTADNDRPWIGINPNRDPNRTFTTDETSLLEIPLIPGHDKESGNDLDYRISLLPSVGKLYQYKSGDDHKGNLIDPNHSIVEDHRVVYEPANGSNTYSVTFSCKVNDGSLDSSNTDIVHVTVNAGNEAPEFSTQDLKKEFELAVGDMYLYTVEATDRDINNTLKFSREILPGWLKLEDNEDGTATLLGRPTIYNTGKAGNMVKIRVDDGHGGFSLLEFTINVIIPGITEIYVNPNNNVIESDEEWRDEKVVIKSEGGDVQAVIVRPDSTLKIAPGTTVEFQNNLGLIVYGTLEADGSSGEIVFKGEDWKGIAFVDPNMYEDPNKQRNDPNSVSVLSYCTLEGVKGVIGAVSATNYAHLKVDHCTLSDNEAIWGGGIYLFNSSPPLMHITISHNNALMYGGGIYCVNSEPDMRDIILTGNKSSQMGGGIYIADANCPTLTNITISNNSAPIGGGLYCSKSNPVLINNLITNNYGRRKGGGIYGESSDLKLIHSTIAMNSSIQGAGIYCDSSSPVVRDTILYGNIKTDLYGNIIKTNGQTDSQYEQVYLDANSNPKLKSNPAFYYCDVQGGRKQFGGSLLGFDEKRYDNEKNMEKDPLFVSLPPQAGVIDDFVPNWSLQSTSPCINAGNPDPNSVISNLKDPNSIEAVKKDLVGTKRPYNATDNGDINRRYLIYPDIGAYECKNNPPFIGMDPNTVIDIQSTTDEDTQIIITLSGGNDVDDPDFRHNMFSFPELSNPDLPVKMVLMPPWSSGTLYQYVPDDASGTYKRGAALSVSNPVVTDTDRRVIYVPANRSCDYTDTFIFKVNDGQMDSSNTEAVDIDVEANNEKPTFTTLPVTGVQASGEYHYRIGVADPDLDDSLTIRCTTSLPAWLNLVDNRDGTSVLLGRPPFDSAGDYPVVLRVLDQKVYTDQIFTITVAPNLFSVNAGPDKSGSPGSPIVLEASVTGCDMAAFNWEYRWEIRELGADGSTSDANSIAVAYPARPFTWTPAWEGIFTATVTVGNVMDEVKLIIADGFANDDDHSLDFNGREGILDTWEAGTGPNSVNRQLGLLDNLVIENPTPSNASAETLTDGQRNKILAILETIADSPDTGVMDKKQIYKAVEVLNEMVHQRGGSYLSSDQAALLRSVVKKIAREGARLGGDLQANSYDSIQISISTIDLTKVKCDDPNATHCIGGPAKTDARVLFPASTLCEIKKRFGNNEVTASVTANKATGSGPGVIVSVSLTQSDGTTDLPVTHLDNPFEIHIPVTDKAKRTPMCFDEASGIWDSKGISETIDLKGDVIIFKASYLSDFALFSYQDEGEDSETGQFISRLDSGCFIRTVTHRYKGEDTR
ncbi:MAG: right-handed parallel beta-helix repeat-containing protein [bacterium]